MRFFFHGQLTVAVLVHLLTWFSLLWPLPHIRQVGGAMVGFCFFNIVLANMKHPSRQWVSVGKPGWEVPWRAIGAHVSRRARIAGNVLMGYGAAWFIFSMFILAGAPKPNRLAESVGGSAGMLALATLAWVTGISGQNMKADLKKRDLWLGN